MDATSTKTPARLVEHLRSWAGAWPPPGAGVTVVANPLNALPGWDGSLHPVTGVVDASGSGVLAVPPEAYALVSRDAPVADILQALPGLVGRPELEAYQAIFRWSTTPADLPDVGTWLPAEDPAIPDWLKPFGGSALVVLDDDGVYVAGVGLKRHDDAGWEIAVGTEPAARGKGLARRLVAQAARAVLARGAVPTYFHDPDNVASAHVAEAAGFPDLGWTAFGTWQPPTPTPDAT
jgi:GNAT superfamily N-acetyltransferase